MQHDFTGTDCMCGMGEFFYKVPLVPHCAPKQQRNAEVPSQEITWRSPTALLPGEGKSQVLPEPLTPTRQLGPWLHSKTQRWTLELQTEGKTVNNSIWGCGQLTRVSDSSSMEVWKSEVPTFPKPHSSSAGKYGLKAKFVSASSQPLYSIERSKNQQVKRQVFFCWICPQNRFKAAARNIAVVTKEGFVLAVTHSPSSHCDSFPSGWGRFWLRALGAPTLDSRLFSQKSNTNNEGPKWDAIIATPAYIAWSFLDINSCLGPHHRALFIAPALFISPDPSGALKLVSLGKYL